MTLHLTRATIWRYGPAVAMSLAVVLLSLAPAWLFRGVARSLPPVAGADKLVHAAMYAVLTAAYLHALPRDARSRVRPLLWIVLAAATFGLVMELLQFALTTTRGMDPLDALANTAGALISALVAFIWTRRHVRRTRL
jgi:VanZ family protein